MSLQSPVTSLYTFRQGWQWSLTPPQIQEWTGSQAVPWPRCPWTSSVSLLCVDAVWSSDCWVSYTTATLKHPVTKEAIVGKGVCASAKQTISGNSPHFKLFDSYCGQFVMSPILLLITSNQKCCTFIILHLTECLFFNIWGKNNI